MYSIEEDIPTGGSLLGYEERRFTIYVLSMVCFSQNVGRHRGWGDWPLYSKTRVNYNTQVLIHHHLTKEQTP